VTEAQPVDDDRPDHVFRWLEATETRVARELEPKLDDLQRALWPRRIRILQLIPASGIRQTELASRAMITKQALGALIDGLEEEGLVERTLDTSDGRAWLVVLSPTGQKVTSSFDESLAEVEDKLTELVGPKDYATFMSVLRKLGHRPA
jgi:DNA-binding MarR family transcriptional regulator